MYLYLRLMNTFRLRTDQIQIPGILFYDDDNYTWSNRLCSGL